MRQFHTAVKAHSKNEDSIGAVVEFEIDGQTFSATGPNATQLAVYLAEVGGFSVETKDRVSAGINFFLDRFSGDDRRYFQRRLMDRNDSFDFQDITDIIEWLTEEWSARPTQLPSDSSGWPQPDGANLTVRHHLPEPRTSSAFGLTDSSTPSTSGVARG